MSIIKKLQPSFSTFSQFCNYLYLHVKNSSDLEVISCDEPLREQMGWGIIDSNDVLIDSWLFHCDDVLKMIEAESSERLKAYYKDSVSTGKGRAEIADVVNNR